MKKSKKGFWIFICPALFAFIVVQIIPTIMGIGYSFTDWNGVGKTKNFVGLGNYITTLTNDTQFRNAFLFTFLFFDLCGDYSQCNWICFSNAGNTKN